ncbi:hypothetical protein CHUAL_005425 [Chamberlinius hualienensis]
MEYLQNSISFLIPSPNTKLYATHHQKPISITKAMKPCVISAYVFLMMLFVSSGNSTPLNIQICLTNCAQCKTMYGNYFDGKQCADACIWFNGKLTPDCNQLLSILPFINRYG